MSAAPRGPRAPAGGWSVVYADGFGACLIDTATGCSLGAPRSDNTEYAMAGNAAPDGGGRSPEVFNANRNDVASDGLHQSCSWAPGISGGANYSCGKLITLPGIGNGGVLGSTTPGSNYKLFHFDPGHDTWAFQWVMKAPPNTGDSAPAFWSYDPSWTWEIDHPEMWGMSGGNQTSGWCTDSMGFASIPQNGGGSTGEDDTSFCQGNVPDPSSGFHTYTVLVQGTTFSSYIDGNLIHSGRNVGGFPATMGGLVLYMSLYNDNYGGGATVGYSSGSRTLITKSIAVYENASANGADTTNSGIAPGTQIH